jgi:hypothetical protein
MKLYRLSVIVGDTTIERGVWADQLTVSDNIYFFHNNSDQVDDLVSTFPVNLTFITSIETKEEYDARKAK